ncbi:MAG: ROK family protein [Planctomycetota bacterium]|nr:ROK family protein [Planctomycetota bacterium]
MSRDVIAYDLGGTNVRCGLVNEAGEIMFRAKQPVGARPKPEDVVGKMVAMAEQLMGEAAKRHDEVACIGIGSPGPLNSRTGTIVETPNLGWKDVPLARLVQERLKRPTFLENDANSACWGEFVRGAGRGCKTMFILTLGTGVGGGLILDGRLWKGIDDIAGHLGHVVVDPDGPKQVFDNPGSLEALCSATAVIRDARAAAKQHPDSKLASVPAEKIDGKFIEECAVAGDAAAKGLFERLGTHLGIACASFANVLNPEVGVIGGGLSAAWNLYAPSMIREMKRRALPPAGARLKLVKAELYDDAGMTGVAGLALKRALGEL